MFDKTFDSPKIDNNSKPYQLTVNGKMMYTRKVNASLLSYVEYVLSTKGLGVETQPKELKKR